VRLTAILLFMAAWQYGAPHLRSLTIPLPADVFEQVWVLAREGVVVSDFSVSLARLGVGFVLTMTLGTALGLAMGRSRLFDALVHDLTIIGITFPYLITALLVAMWIGFGSVGPVLVMVTAGMPFIALNVAQGVKAVDKKLVDMARSFDVGDRLLLRHVIFPSVYPFLFAAVRLVWSVGWRALIVAEMFASTSGAGYGIAHYWRTGQSAKVGAMAIYFAVVAVIVERIFAAASRRVFRWRPATVGVTIPRVQ
jgi:NitT/TauT family transport system permease protein